MSQPDWEFVANIGDKNIVDYGGCLIYRDKSNVYEEEAEKFFPDECDDELGPDADRGPDDNYGSFRRWILERCTYINGILSDNKFHPDHPCWWADDIDKLASFTGMENYKLIGAFCSADPVERAIAYEVLGDYFGYSNLDDYPVLLTYAEAEERYKEEMETK